MSLNNPASAYLKKKGKCAFSRVGFNFKDGQLDVLAYDRREKCFHICEGKRAFRLASIGHAIGQVIAYYSTIQENGYDFLQRVSREEKLELSDFDVFLERKKIKIYFYIVLPLEKQKALLPATRIILGNLGNLGGSIGVMFASKNKCVPMIEPKPVDIPIGHIFNIDSFFVAVEKEIKDTKKYRTLEIMPVLANRYLRIKEKKGNPYLHYEVWFRKKGKKEDKSTIEVAFHVELAKAHLKHAFTRQRKSKLLRILYIARKALKAEGSDFKFDKKWGKNWARLYKNIYVYDKLDDGVLDEVLRALKKLIAATKPKLDAANWGRQKKTVEE